MEIPPKKICSDMKISNKLRSLFSIKKSILVFFFSSLLNQWVWWYFNDCLNLPFRTVKKLNWTWEQLHWTLPSYWFASFMEQSVVSIYTARVPFFFFFAFNLSGMFAIKYSNTFIIHILFFFLFFRYSSLKDNSK